MSSVSNWISKLLIVKSLQNLFSLIDPLLTVFRKGVFYWLGTRGGREPYQNPHVIGEVSARMRSVHKGDPQNLLDNAHQGDDPRVQISRNT